MKKFTKSILKDKRKQFIIIISTVILVALSFMSVNPFDIVKMKVLPPKDGQTLGVYIDLPAGSTLLQTKQVVKEIYKILEKEAEIKDIETFYGMGAPTDLIGLIKSSPLRSGEQSAQIVVNLTKSHDRDEKSFLIAKRLREEVTKLHLADTDILVVEEPAGPPVIGAIVTEIYGENQKKREEIAINIANIFYKINGLVDIDIQKEEAFKKFMLSIDKDKALKSGLSIEQINKIVYASFEGINVGVKNEINRNDQVALHLVLDNDSKKLSSLNQKEIEFKLSELKLMTNNGRMISLNEVVSVFEEMSSPTIYSKNLQDYTIVSAETDLVSPIYPGLKAIKIIKQTMNDDYEITHGSIFKREKGKYFDLYLKDKKDGKIYQIVWEGELQVSLDMAIDLGITLLISIGLIMTLLIFYYQSFILPLIVLMGSLLSLIGVMAGHIIMNIFSEYTIYFTGTSLIGVIALIGISARNTVLLIDNMKSLMKNGMEKDPAIIEATGIRAKPILLTAIGVMLGSSLLIPDSVFGGLGISLTFGTITATIASLVIAPILLKHTKLNRQEILE